MYNLAQEFGAIQRALVARPPENLVHAVVFPACPVLGRIPDKDSYLRKFGRQLQPFPAQSQRIFRLSALGDASEDQNHAGELSRGVPDRSSAIVDRNFYAVFPNQEGMVG